MCKKRFASSVVLFALCLVLTGCKSKITLDNYAKIELGMSLEEVEHFLGNGTPANSDGSLVAAQVGVDVGSGASRSSTVEYVWERGNNSITVAFRQDKVVAKRKTGF